MIRTILCAFTLTTLLSCTEIQNPVPPDYPEEEWNDNQENKMPETIKISVSGKSPPVKKEDNVATMALVARAGFGYSFLE